MTIKQKGIISIAAIAVGFMGIVGGNYYSNYKIKKAEELLVSIENAKTQAINTKLKHVEFLSQFEKDFLQKKESKLTSDPTKCALAKFLRNHEKEFPPSLQ